MRIVALASGSSGNALLVDAGETRVLIDCGIGPRTLRTHLRVAGVQPEAITAVIVTHEHVDHTRGLGHAVRRWRWPVLASAGTVRGLPPAVRPHARPVCHTALVGGLEVEFIAIAHDANEPTAIAITDRATGLRAGIAHDLGTASDSLIRAFHGVDLLCIEANHDAEMLRTGPYPGWLKDRVAGTNGHLSNVQSAAVIDAVSTRALRAVVLLHLSAVNNTPLLACTATRRALMRRSRRASLAAATRKAPSAAIGEALAPQFALAI